MGPDRVHFYHWGDSQAEELHAVTGPGRILQGSFARREHEKGGITIWMGSLAGLRVNLARGTNLLVGSNGMIQGCSTKLWVLYRIHIMRTVWTGDILPSSVLTHICSPQLHCNREIPQSVSTGVMTKPTKGSPHPEWATFRRFSETLHGKHRKAFPSQEMENKQKTTAYNMIEVCL